MILQALTEHYERKARSGDPELAPLGFEKKEIPFVIVLNEDGEFIDLEDMRTGEGKKKTGRMFTVPQGEKKTSGILANLLWDSLGYVFGIVSLAKAEKLGDVELERERKRTQEMHAAFIHRIRDTFPKPINDPGINAVLTFLERGDFSHLYGHPLWEEVRRDTGAVTFRLDTDIDVLICQRETVRNVIEQSRENNPEERRRCLVTGENDTIARIHPAIKGVWGAQTSGANIVSFNFDAAESYGRGRYKRQGLNAPVGQYATFAYTTALNHLLQKGSRQRMQVGDTSTVFWAERKHPVEDDFLDWIEENPDDPERHTEAVRALYAAPHKGTVPVGEDRTRFYVLGLAPNAARIAIRFWYHTTVGKLARHIRQHFDDLCIVHGPNEQEFLPLFRLLVTTAALGKTENIPPNFAADVMKAILAGTPYPYALVSAVIRRIHAEHHVGYARAALIKAVLVRHTRLRNPNQQEVDVSLDEKNPNAGYRLGRLFAVLERIQESANPGINATIRDRFYASASSIPVTAFPHLLKLKNHHLSKLENRGQVIYLEKLIGHIMDGIDTFPAHLSLDDQGRFSIGYYHQRQAFFTKSENKSVQGEQA